jgi:hypothetical protein
MKQRLPQMLRLIYKTLEKIDRQNEKVTSENEKKAKLNFWKDIALIVIPIVTAAFIGWQACLSHSSFIIENRAYLSATCEGIIPNPKNPGIFKIHITNHGNVRTNIEAKISCTRVGGGFNTVTWDSVRANKGLINPGATYTVIAVMPALSFEEIDAIETGKGLFKVEGNIVYSTGFGKKDFMPVVFWYNSRTKEWDNINTGVFINLERNKDQYRKK